MEASALDDLRIVLDPIGQIGVALALAFIMFGVALGLKTSDFIFLRANPKLFFGGVAAQLIGLPLVTLLIVMALQPAPSIALGMFVVASCPGGSSSNLLTYLARGNVAYSVSLTATSSLIAALFTPVSILFWSDLYGPTSSLLSTLEFNALSFVIQTTILLAVPLFLGMVIAHYAPKFAEAVRKQFSLLGAGLLLVVILYGTIQFFPILIAALPLLLSLVAIHNSVAFAVGAISGRLMGADTPTRRALTFEVGIQNSGLAIVILLSQLSGLGGAAAIAAVWGIWHLIAGGAIVGLYRWLDAREQRASP